MQNPSISGVWISSSTGRRIGIETASRTAPISPPMADAENAAPKARPASPLRAIGYPSIMVAAEPTVPGTPSNTVVIVSDVTTTEDSPIRKASAV